MFEYALNQVREIEASLPRDADRQFALRSLRGLTLTDFGELMFSMPDERFPRLSRLLPRMASDEVQMNWTGATGMNLLSQTLDFVRSVAFGYTNFSGRALQGSTIMDFGCGYGRMIRMMYYFSDPERVYGVDPWDRSIEVCRSAGLENNMYLSEYMPTDLPVGEVNFDLIFAFSVFTHLSARATKRALRIIERYITDDGVIVITVRPVEYWNVDKISQRHGTSARHKEAHQRKGFTFQPHGKPDPGKEVFYGDTSFSLDWLAETASHLQIVGMERVLSDPYQLYVFLKRR